MWSNDNKDRNSKKDRRTVTEFKKDKLDVKIADSRAAMGEIAGRDIADCILRLQKEKDEINIIFAAAPSQNETLAKLLTVQEIDWSKINAFHMDEYIGLAEDAPQRFGNFLKEAIFGRVVFKSVHYINGGAEDIAAECARYSALLAEYPTDIVCLGIGENGHIAFNDPPVADFNDAAVIKPVQLDEICRHQPILGAADMHAQHGTTAILPTSLACSTSALMQFLTDMKTAMQKRPNILGAHLEGSYFALEQSGAQNPNYIKPPCKEEYDALFPCTALKLSFKKFIALKPDEKS